MIRVALSRVRLLGLKVRERGHYFQEVAHLFTGSVNNTTPVYCGKVPHPKFEEGYCGILNVLRSALPKAVHVPLEGL